MGKSVGRFEIGNRLTACLGLCLFLFGIGAAGARAIKKYHTPGPFSHDAAGFCDFHNGLYFPTRALIDGVSPYSSECIETYSMSRQLPFFSPAILALHIPLAMLPLRAAEILYYAMLSGIALAIGGVVASLVGKPRRLDWLLAIAGLFVVTRGAHSMFYDGYFTFELTLATILAVHWSKTRPWLAAIALVIVSAKPTYILPLGFLLLARGNYKALTIGAVFSIVAAFLPFAWIASHSDGDFVSAFVNIFKEIQQSQEFHTTVLDETPVHTWTRIDSLAIAAKWLNANPSQTIHVLVMFPLIVLPMIVLFRRQRLGIDDGAAGLTGLVVLSTALATVYHHSYDALLLMLPLVAVLVPDIDRASKVTDDSSDIPNDETPAALHTWRQHSKFARWAIALLAFVPLYNYVSSRVIIARFADSMPVLYKVVTSVSGVALTALVVVACVLAWRETTTKSASMSE